MNYKEKVIALLKSQELSKEQKEKLESIFPELTESEDERIRKALYLFVEAYGAHANYEVTREEMLAWLEKQGTDISSFPKEQQVFMQKYVSLDKITLIKLLAERDANNAEIIESFEKQGEQKPTNNVKLKFKVGDTIVEKDIDECGYGTIKNIKNGQYIFTDGSAMNINEQNGWQLVKTPKNIEQEPSWSEEDEEQARQIERIVHNEGYSKKLQKQISDWLKSLKDRVQPKVELTQLDKNILEAAIAFVEQNNHFNYWRGVDKHTVLSALHSLKPQNTWKPSDEQMKALNTINVTGCITDIGQGRLLVELYQDLKKLKEE